jgi:hypothetical protein
MVAVGGCLPALDYKQATSKSVSDTWVDLGSVKIQGCGWPLVTGTLPWGAGAASVQVCYHLHH